MPAASLSTWFVEAVPKGRRPDPSAALEEALVEALAAARQAHPQLGVADEAFIRHLAGCADSAEALKGLHCADVFLALACSTTDARALAELNRRISHVVPRAVSQLKVQSAFVDEVRQLLAQRLLVRAEGSAVRLLDYQGRGPLDRWLRAAALRVALNLLETDKSPREQGDSAIRSLPDQGDSPETQHLRRRYAPEFKAAVEAALKNLSPKERNFLRMYFVDGLTVEQIGAMQGAHKSTVSRWISRARETVGGQVRQLLEDRLHLSSGELDSLMGLLRSELELSLYRVL